MGQLEFTVDPAAAPDLPILAATAMASWQASIGQLIDAGSQRKFQTSSPFLPYLRQYFDRCLVAKLRGFPVGWLGRSEEPGFITDLWINPNYWGAGAATALVSTAKTEAAAAGCLSLTLETASENTRAVSFYQHQGFQIVWTAGKYDNFVGQKIEKIGMQCALNLREAELR
jgi:ribosomal-protein-alanine N-acetyltransferase